MLLFLVRAGINVCALQRLQLTTLCWIAHPLAMKPAVQMNIK